MYLSAQDTPVIHNADHFVQCWVNYACLSRIHEWLEWPEARSSSSESIYCRWRNIWGWTGLAPLIYFPGGSAEVPWPPVIGVARHLQSNWTECTPLTCLHAQIWVCSSLEFVLNYSGSGLLSNRCRLTACTISSRRQWYWSNIRQHSGLGILLENAQIKKAGICFTNGKSRSLRILDRYVWFAVSKLGTYLRRKSHPKFGHPQLCVWLSIQWATSSSSWRVMTPNS